MRLGESGDGEARLAREGLVLLAVAAAGGGGDTAGYRRLRWKLGLDICLSTLRTYMTTNMNA